MPRFCVHFLGFRAFRVLNCIVVGCTVLWGVLVASSVPLPAKVMDTGLYTVSYRCNLYAGPDWSSGLRSLCNI